MEKTKTLGYDFEVRNHVLDELRKDQENNFFDYLTLITMMTNMLYDLEQSNVSVVCNSKLEKLFTTEFVDAVLWIYMKYFCKQHKIKIKKLHQYISYYYQELMQSLSKETIKDFYDTIITYLYEQYKLVNEDKI